MARNKFDIDERLEGEFNMSHAKRLLGYLKPYKSQVIRMITLILITSILGIVSPYLVKTAMDKQIPNGDITGIVLSALMLVAVNVVSLSIIRYRIKNMSILGQDVVKALRKDVFAKLQQLPFSYFDNRPHGKILVRIVNYVNSISDLLSNGLINLIADIFTLLVVGIFMFGINYKLALIAMIPLPIFIVLVFIVQKFLRRAWQDFSAKNSNMNAYIHESIAGMKVTQAFSREARNLRIFREQQDACRKKFMKAVYIQHAVPALVDTASYIARCLLFVFGIGWVVSAVTIPSVGFFENPLLYLQTLFSGSEITIGTLMAFTTYVVMFWNPIVNLANFYNSITTAMAYMERVFELLDEKLEVHDVEGATIMPQIKGNVEFNHVAFAYEPSKMILKDINFKVTAGETIALVGPTGAGKTTVINLLSRFYNLTAGEVLFDGVDISQVTLKSLRKQMGVMLQDTFIFAGTIMENIKYGKLDATDEEAVNAAKIVCAHDFIKDLEDGYNTEVNERGSRLSVGQRQLISFARALLADPKILILDEATSSIDTETEIVLQRGLDELLKGRTSFIIAHRLSTIKSADRIMYIDQGKVVESGSHDELMIKKGAYYQLYTAQYSFLEAM